MVKNESNKFLSDEESARVVEAIRDAERLTSGEIRVHLASRVRGDVYREAVRFFNKLGMSRTVRRNGCLILVDVGGKRVTVIGDRGINERVPEGFWNEVVDELIAAFTRQDYSNGLVNAVGRIGKKLQKYFPYEHGDLNELSDELSCD
jgi:uncharacterized membrane protein